MSKKRKVETFGKCVENIGKSKMSEKKIGKIYKLRNSLKIIMVGRLSKEKDHITFLKCLKILSKKINLESIILGSGNQKDKIKNTIYKYKLDRTLSGNSKNIISLDCQKLSSIEVF